MLNVFKFEQRTLSSEISIVQDIDIFLNFFSFFFSFQFSFLVGTKNHFDDRQNYNTSWITNSHFATSRSNSKGHYFYNNFIYHNLDSIYIFIPKKINFFFTKAQVVISWSLWLALSLVTKYYETPTTFSLSLFFPLWFHWLISTIYFFSTEKLTSQNDCGCAFSQNCCQCHFLLLNPLEFVHNCVHLRTPFCRKTHALQGQPDQVPHALHCETPGESMVHKIIYTKPRFHLH